MGVAVIQVCHPRRSVQPELERRRRDPAVRSPAQPGRDARRMRLKPLAALVILALGYLPWAPVQAGATLYSFGAAAGDLALPRCDDCYEAVTTAGTGPAGSALSLSFFGKSYTGLFVNNNGLVSFNAGVSAWTGQAFPYASGWPLIAAYWADVDTRPAASGQVWHRTTQDASLLATLGSEIRGSFLGATSFNPTFAEVVTWDHVGYYSAKTDKLNTFQLVVVSDGSYSYSLFKYPSGGINWAYGQVSGGTYAQVGFDAGDGSHYYNAVGSRTAQMLNLPNLTSTVPGNPGTQAYRIDGNAITASPTFGSMTPSARLPTHTWTAAGGSSSWLVDGGNWGAIRDYDPYGSPGPITGADPRTTWRNGDSAIFDGAAATVTLSGTVVARRVSANTTGYRFVSSVAGTSLQLDALTVPSASTTVSFGGNLVLITHQGDGGLAWSEAAGAFVQRGALAEGQLVFTDTSVLVARDAAMVNGAALQLKKAAQLQLYTAGATTRASTLSFDNTDGGTGGTLDLRGLSTTMGAVRSLGATPGAGLITNSGTALAGLTVDFDVASTQFGGVIRNGTGALALTKAGTGSWTLSGANSYSGGTTLAGGVLSVSAAANLGSGSLTFAGGTLSNSRDIITRRNVALVGGGGSFNTAGGYFTLNGSVSGAGGLTKTGGNILTLAGAQTYTGASKVNAGMLKFSADGANASSVASSSFMVAAGATLLFSDTQTVAAPITGGGTLVHEFAGATTLTGAATHTGGTSVIGGVLQVGNGGGSGALAGNVALSGGGTLAFNRSDAQAFAGVISGAGGVVQRGTGVLTLSGASTYSGATMVQSGELRLDGSVAGSAVTVAAGARLSGSGQLGALTVAGVLAPGHSPGLLSAGATTFAGGGRYLWEINDALGLAGVGYDSLSVAGALTLGATAANPFTVTLRSLLADNSAGAVSGFDARHSHRYTLASASGGIVGFEAGGFAVDASGFSNALQGGQWSVSASGNGLDLVFQAAAVPEPQSLVMLLAGLAGLAALGRVRRRRG